MSVTESKAKTPAKTSKKAAQAAAAETLKAALEAATLEYVPLSGLVKSPLNVRVIPYPAESVRSLADTIKAIGLRKIWWSIRLLTGRMAWLPVAVV